MPACERRRHFAAFERRPVTRRAPLGVDGFAALYLLGGNTPFQTVRTGEGCCARAVAIKPPIANAMSAANAALVRDTRIVRQTERDVFARIVAAADSHDDVLL